MYHYTYLITNKINNKVYYGVRSCKCLPEEDTNYWGSGYAMKSAINKYGIDNFTKEVDGIFETREDANLYEAEIVDINWVEWKDTYNLREGGLNGLMSEESKSKLSKSRLGCEISKEARKKISESKMGHNVSKDTRKKISESIKGKKHWNYGKHHSTETKEKIGKVHKGKIVSKETRKKMSESHKGEKNWNYGKHLSKETRNKIREANTGEKHYNYSKHRSDETKMKISEAHKGKIIKEETKIKMAKAKAKHWIAISPYGIEFDFYNLSEFCRLHNLNRDSMTQIAKGNQRYHKGWKCKKLG